MEGERNEFYSRVGGVEWIHLVRGGFGIKKNQGVNGSGKCASLLLFEPAGGLWN